MFATCKPQNVSSTPHGMCLSQLSRSFKVTYAMMMPVTGQHMLLFHLSRATFMLHL